MPTYWEQTGKINPYAVNPPYQSEQAAYRVQSIVGGTIFALNAVKTFVPTIVMGDPIWYITIPNAPGPVPTTKGPAWPVDDIAKALNEYDPDRLRVWANEVGITKFGPPPAPSLTAYTSNYILNPTATTPVITQPKPVSPSGSGNNKEPLSANQANTGSISTNNNLVNYVEDVTSDIGISKTTLLIGVVILGLFLFKGK